MSDRKTNWELSQEVSELRVEVEVLRNTVNGLKSAIAKYLEDK
jgi:hypothetical protein